MSDPSFVAERGVHYTQEAAPETQPWSDAQLEHGIRRKTLALPAGKDFEVWIRLQSPTTPDQWIEQDPIVRTGSGGNHAG
ncbi:MAG: hypothetical protein MJE77_23940 [Proteobacteria bacterium]|nr:hypothetical protein [Pseudomonadota bacterium]